MNMVKVSINEVNIHSFINCIFPDMIKYLLPDFIFQQRISVFGCPDKVNPNFYISHHHYILG